MGSSEAIERLPRPPVRRSSLLRFLAYVAPHTWYIVGAALTGVLKFVIPLAFPLVLKYLTDSVLARDPVAAHESTNRWLDAWCNVVLGAAPGLGHEPGSKVLVICVLVLGLDVGLG